MHNTIEMLNTHGDVVLRTAEGHYVLTQQIKLPHQHRLAHSPPQQRTDTQCEPPT